MVFETFLKEKSEIYLKETSTLNEAMKYSLLAPGKRIRPLLAMGFSQGFKGKSEVAIRSGVAIEMIHAYSLVHDDLPSMDNDDYRRGRLTNHKVYGEAIAILAGDSLLNLAPEFLLKELALLNFDPVLSLELVSLLLEYSGHQGMVKGQAMDMKYESEDLSKFDHETLDSILRNIHKLKTGAIITWSCLAGLYSTGDRDMIKKYKCQVQSIGQRIGLLFQMVDDVLDVTASLKELGKTPGKDARKGKLTYTNLHGLTVTTEMARNLVNDIQADLESFHELQGDWSVILEIVESLKSKLP